MKGFVQSSSLIYLLLLDFAYFYFLALLSPFQFHWPALAALPSLPSGYQHDQAVMYDVLISSEHSMCKSLLLAQENSIHNIRHDEMIRRSTDIIAKVVVAGMGASFQSRGRFMLALAYTSISRGFDIIGRVYVHLGSSLKFNFTLVKLTKLTQM
jgi:hypothetical protein